MAKAAQTVTMVATNMITLAARTTPPGFRGDDGRHQHDHLGGTHHATGLSGPRGIEPRLQRSTAGAHSIHLPRTSSTTRALMLIRLTTQFLAPSDARGERWIDFRSKPICRAVQSGPGGNMLDLQIAFLVPKNSNVVLEGRQRCQTQSLSGESLIVSGIGVGHGLGARSPATTSFLWGLRNSASRRT
jgi:hypothetical protein